MGTQQPSEPTPEQGSPRASGMPPCALFAMDALGQIQDVNEAAAQLTGYSLAELRSMNILDLLAATDHPWQEKGDLRWPDEATHEVRLRHRQGHMILVDWTISSLHLGHQPITIGTARTIRSRVETEKTLQTTLDQLQLAIDTARLGIWRLNIETGRMEWNDQLLEIYGISRDAFQHNADGWRAQVHPDDVAYADGRLAEVFEGKSVYDVEFRFIRPDGEIRYANASATPIYDQAQKLVELIGINADVTHIKRSEQELRAGEARFRSLFNAIPVPTYAWQRVDDDFVLADYNEMALAITKGQIVNFIGAKASEFYKDEPQVLEDLARCCQQKTIIQREMLHRFRTTGETKFVNIRYAYVPDNIVMAHAEDVTERKRIEQKLIDSEARFRSLMEQSPLPTAIFAPDGTLIDGNPALSDLWRLSPDASKALGRLNVLKSQHYIDLGIHEYVQRAFAGEPVLIPLYESDAGRSLSEFGVAVDKTEKRWLRSHYYPIKDATGTLLNVVLVHEDVTEQKRADDALKQAQELFEKAFFHSPVAMNMINILTGKRRAMNDRFSDLVGYTREEYDVATFASLNLFVNPTARDLAVAELLANKQLYHYPVQIRNKQGDVKDLLAYATLLDSIEEGLALISWIDVTQLNQTQKKLRQLSQAIEQSPVSVVITNLNGIIEYVNPKFCEVTGYTVDEAIGQNPRIIKSGQHPPAFYRQLWQVISSGQVWQGELQNRKKNGELYWERAIIAGVKDQNGVITHYVSVKEDITERRRVEEAQFRQERLAAVGQMAAGIAHDFNNILGVIVIYAQMLSRAKELPARFQERAAVIHQQAIHASNLVQQILDFSRRSNLEKQPLNLLPLLKEQVKLLQRTLPEHIEIHFDYADKEYMLNADPTRIQQVVANLVINARDAMPAGGVLALALSKISLSEDGLLPLEMMTPGTWIKLSVADTGMGMSAEVMAHIFEPFFTTKERGRGTGLGLAQVYGIVKQHGGFIDVKSEIGVGTLFDLYFQPLPQAEDVIPGFPDLDQLPQGAGQSILIVEDDDSLRKVISDLLASWNYNVLTAANGLEGQQILAAAHADVAMVISDVIMPKMGGVEFLAHVQVSYPHIPIVLMTGHLEEEKMREVQATNLKRWVQKPLNIPALARIVADMLDGADTCDAS